MATLLVNRLVRLSTAAALASSLCGCDTGLDKSSEIKTLRVLAVRAEQSYLKPGAQTRLEMLYHDGSPRAVRPDGSRRPVRIVWISTCTNPAGDQYDQCYPGIASFVAALDDSVLASGTVPANDPGLQGRVAFGTSLTVTMPADAIASRPPSPGTVIPYGMHFAFFVACGGELRKRSGGGKAFPIACVDPASGAELGSDDAVVGYFPLHAYDAVTNANPTVGGVELNGATHAHTACSADSGCPTGQACSSAGECVPIFSSCEAEDAADCPAFPFKPLVDPSSVELAVGSQTPPPIAPPETLWASFYTSGGSFKTPSKLVNDVDMGWYGSYEGLWRAHKARGEVRLWAVVRDSRQGVAWAWQDVKVQ
jgi:hypothetical protein